MPYIFTIQNTPAAGDVATLAMTDGNGVQRNYVYTVLENDTLQDISDAIKTLVNADTFFVAVDQTTYPTQVGLEVSQVATNAYAQFNGIMFIAPAPLNTSPAFTMAFDEIANAFEGRRSYEPENWGCLGTLLVSFKDGGCWTHDNPITNNWYGIQYESWMKVVFNENPLLKKTFMAISEVSNTIWDCPEISTNIRSANTVQQSNLITQDFSLIEGNYESDLKADQNSPGGIINGDSMKGNFIVVKFRAQDFQTNNFVYLALINMRYVDSPLNNR